LANGVEDSKKRIQMFKDKLGGLAGDAKTKMQAEIDKLTGGLEKMKMQRDAASEDYARMNQEEAKHAGSQIQDQINEIATEMTGRKADMEWQVKLIAKAQKQLQECEADGKADPECFKANNRQLEEAQQRKQEAQDWLTRAAKHRDQVQADLDEQMSKQAAAETFLADAAEKRAKADMANKEKEY